MNCLLVMKIKWSLDINTGAVERSEAARARCLAGATVVGDDVIASTGYMKKQPIKRPPQNCDRLRSVPIISPLLYIHFSFRTKTTPEFRITTYVFCPVHVLGLIITTTSSHSESYIQQNQILNRLLEGCHSACDTFAGNN